MIFLFDNYRLNKGFTIIELVVVIAVVAFIASSIFVAIDPAKRIGNAGI